MRSPKNTTEEMRTSSGVLGFLLSSLALGGSGAIEAMESRGQSELVQGDSLPTDMREGSREALEAAGAKFNGLVPGDAMFQYVELPKGWTKAGTDHAMWSNLKDEKGRVRASIFYKAASYDRSAHMGMNNRYSASKDYSIDKGPFVAKDHDGTVLFAVVDDVPGRDWKMREDKQKEVSSWLDANFPDWKNPMAYWD